jgi:hypothetical protein
MRRNAREAALEGIAEADPRPAPHTPGARHTVNGAAERCDSHGECAPPPEATRRQSRTTRALLEAVRGREGRAVDLPEGIPIVTGQTP